MCDERGGVLVTSVMCVRRVWRRVGDERDVCVMSVCVWRRVGDERCA